MVKCQKESSHYICLSVILIDFVFEMGKNYYPQVFLEDVNINMLLKKKKRLAILLKNYKFLLMIEINLKKNSFSLINAQKSLTGMKPSPFSQH